MGKVSWHVFLITLNAFPRSKLYNTTILIESHTGEKFCH